MTFCVFHLATRFCIKVRFPLDRFGLKNNFYSGRGIGFFFAGWIRSAPPDTHNPHLEMALPDTKYGPITRGPCGDSFRTTSVHRQTFCSNGTSHTPPDVFPCRPLGDAPHPFFPASSFPHRHAYFRPPLRRFTCSPKSLFFFSRPRSVNNFRTPCPPPPPSTPKFLRPPTPFSIE